MAGSYHPFSPMPTLRPITRKVASFRHRELTVHHDYIRTLLDDRRRSQAMSLAGVFMVLCPDAPPEAIGTRFDQWPQEIRDKFIRLAEIAIGRLNVNVEALAKHAAARQLRKVLASTALAPETIDSLARLVLDTYDHVLACGIAMEQPDATAPVDPRRV